MNSWDSTTEGSAVQLNPTLTQFHLHGKFWINMIKMGYCIYSKYSVVSDLCLHSLPGPGFQIPRVNTVNLSNQNPSEIILDQPL